MLNIKVACNLLSFLGREKKSKSCHQDGQLKNYLFHCELSKHAELQLNGQPNQNALFGWSFIFIQLSGYNSVLRKARWGYLTPFFNKELEASDFFRPHEY